MYQDLAEHIGIVIIILIACLGMIGSLIVFIWKGKVSEISRFPNWLEEMDKKGGVVSKESLYQELKKQEHEDEIYRTACQKTIEARFKIDYTKLDQATISLGEISKTVGGNKEILDRLIETVSEIILHQRLVLERLKIPYTPIARLVK